MSILTFVRSSPDQSVLPVEFLVPAIVYLVSLAVRTGYELLKESGRIGEGNKGAFAVGGMVLGVPGIASILWWRHLEDVRLEVQFGSAYREYRETTWF